MVQTRAINYYCYPYCESATYTLLDGRQEFGNEINTLLLLLLVINCKYIAYISLCVINYIILMLELQLSQKVAQERTIIRIIIIILKWFKKIQIFTPKKESCVDDIWAVHDKIGNELLLLLFCCGMMTSQIRSQKKILAVWASSFLLESFRT
jgi:hypothetical protein